MRNELGNLWLRADSSPVGRHCGDRHAGPYPVGSFALRGTTWTVSNQTIVTQGIQASAIVLAIVLFIFCLLGLLFLLVKERRVNGAVQVSVAGTGFSHSTYIPVYNEMAVFQVSRQVDWIRYRVGQFPA